MTDTHLSDIKFSQFDLAPTLLQALDDAGFEFCTPIQAETLPKTLAGQNIIGQAQTGSGKTAAFLVSTMQHLLGEPRNPQHQDGQPRALILAPTRELVVQIHNDAQQLSQHTNLRVGVAFGGMDYEKQRRSLEQGMDILIGTPGRLIDYFKQKVFNLHSIEVVVLDEADRMFDLGFIKDLRYILRRLPPAEQRLNLMFSATLSLRVTELAYEQMDNPQLIKTEAREVTADKVEQSAYYVGNEEKIPLLIGLFRKLAMERCIVFINTKNEAERLTRYLKGNDIQAETLSGDVPQRKRQRLVQEFEEGKFPMLVATDVAARGLHIPDVTHVINYDLPQDPEDYVHRIGRTGRIGATGQAISFVCETYAFHWPDIEEYVGRKIPVDSVTSDLLPELKPPLKREKKKHPPQGRGKGRRGGQGDKARRSSRPRNRKSGGEPAKQS